MANPNPTRITAPMWRLWEDRPVPAWLLGGIYARKSGYHGTRAENQANFPGNYSIRLSLDLQGPGDKAAGIDYTMSDAEMRKRTGFLVAAAGRRDPRLFAVREFYGTVDSKKVVGRIKTTRTGEWSASSSDSSHLWHIHVSLFRAYVATWVELGPVLSVLAGESLAQWEARISGGTGIMFPKHGDGKANGQDEVVRYWQRMVLEAGGALSRFGIDGEYGDELAAAVAAFWTSVGGGAFSGRSITSAVAVRLQQAALGGERGPRGERGPAGEDGDDGPPGPGPSQAQISQAVDGWLVQHVEDIRGPAGPPGKTPTKVAISGDVIATES